MQLLHILKITSQIQILRYFTFILPNGGLNDTESVHIFTFSVIIVVQFLAGHRDAHKTALYMWIDRYIYFFVYNNYLSIV